MPSRRDVLRGIAAGSLVGLAGCTDETVSGEWPRAGYDRRNTGDATDRDGPGRSLTTAWSASVPESITTRTPAIADGRVYVSTADDDVRGDGTVGFRVFDADDGEQLRDVTVTSEPEFVGAIELLPDSLVVSNDAVCLVAFDGIHSYTPDGEKRWHRPLPHNEEQSYIDAAHPVVAGDTVFAPTGGIKTDAQVPTGLLAIDDASGELQWRYDGPTGQSESTFSVAYADGTVYLSMLDTGVVALTADGGEVEWLREVPAAGPPTVADGRVYVPTEVIGSDEGAIRALDAATGDRIWRQAGAGEQFGRAIAAADGRIYCREDLDAVVCRDGATGEEVWRYATSDYPSKNRPVLMGDAVYVGINAEDDERDGIVALDPTTGDRVGGVGLEKNTGARARIAASEKRLFVTTGRDRVHAVEACTVDAFGRCLR
jgi:outer membrane protein assembly factor BamB